MYVMDVASFDAIEDMLTSYLNKPHMARGKSRKAEEIANAEQIAFTEAFAECMKSELSRRRCEVYKSLGKNLPMVEAWEVRKIIQAAKPLYRATKISPDKKGEREEIFDETRDQLLALIKDESLDGLLEDARRKAILEGREDPKPEDAEWLRKSYSTYSSMQEPYEAALRRLEAIEGSYSG